jgi:hypothetical protein
MASAGLLALGCRSTPTEILGDTDQFFLFEVEYASSWFPTWTGIAIDRDGRVVRYRREETPWIPVDDSSITRAELEAKYAADATQIVTIDAETVAERFASIAGVGQDFAEPNLACADAGFLRYNAFAFDEATHRYRPLLLRAEGDFPTQNTSDEARELAAWLRTVLEQHPVDGVRPFDEGTCTP